MLYKRRRLFHPSSNDAQDGISGNFPDLQQIPEEGRSAHKMASKAKSTLDDDLKQLSESHNLENDEEYQQLDKLEKQLEQDAATLEKELLSLQH